MYVFGRRLNGILGAILMLWFFLQAVTKLKINEDLAGIVPGLWTGEQAVLGWYLLLGSALRFFATQLHSSTLTRRHAPAVFYSRIFSVHLMYVCAQVIRPLSTLVRPDRAAAVLPDAYGTIFAFIEGPALNGKMQVETLGKVFEALWITKDQVVGALCCANALDSFVSL